MQSSDSISLNFKSWIKLIYDKITYTYSVINEFNPTFKTQNMGNEAFETGRYIFFFQPSFFIKISRFKNYMFFLLFYMFKLLFLKTFLKWGKASFFIYTSFFFSKICFSFFNPSFFTNFQY